MMQLFLSFEHPVLIFTGKSEQNVPMPTAKLVSAPKFIVKNELNKGQ
jgi:hypothetical protein